MCTGEGIMEWWNDGMVLKDIMKTVGPGKMHRYSNNNYYYYYTRLTGLFHHNLGKPVPERKNQSGFK